MNLIKPWLLIGVLGVLIIGGWVIIRSRGATPHQTAVRERGQTVMPFDLDQTLHTFQTTPSGGVETVVARDAGNTAQIALIQDHLAHEAAQFQQGDFTDPATIHGSTMPGLAALEQGAPFIRFDYHDLPDGGQITYTATDPILIAAIHEWFGAQLTDHGHDAVGH